MKRLHIDLAPFSVRRPLYRMHPAARWLALAGLLLCVLAGLRAQKQLTRLHSLDREAMHLAARAAESARSLVRVSNEPVDAKQASAINAAVGRLNLPWDDILNAVEAATPHEVALLSITPEPARALLKIEAEGSSSDAMIAYLKALEQQALFGRVYLVRNERARDQADGVIRFQIEAEWRRSGS
ncbi:MULTISPECIES: PilN domain-containing protein [Paraburkholderia]|uniref:PilN domain-containing protein n=1 Tax=Paraburkholderia TaxID=1822464 RepID=UPI0022574B1F|nr:MULTISPECIES: PilN domain-containing protein [Paraburkholderia]MCX4176509.1 PilN domain-containing protein [Paraburkholderia madseniana]MDQ6464501.1 PilN domain-containing protein [Paraburkholderia madseniana]